jgi:hypothetical protein
MVLRTSGVVPVSLIASEKRPVSRSIPASEHGADTMSMCAALGISMHRKSGSPCDRPDTAKWVTPGHRMDPETGRRGSGSSSVVVGIGSYDIDDQASDTAVDHDRAGPNATLDQSTVPDEKGKDYPPCACWSGLGHSKFRIPETRSTKQYPLNRGCSWSPGYSGHKKNRRKIDLR